MMPEVIAVNTIDNGDDDVILLPPSIPVTSEHPHSTTKSVDWKDHSPDSSWRANVFMVRQENRNAEKFRSIDYSS